METIKEAANKYSMCSLNCDAECDTFETEDEKMPCCNRLQRKSFIDAVAWAERWIPIKEELPDFKEHKYVLGRNENQNGFYYAIVYDMKVLKTCYTHWRPIEHK